MVSPIVACVTAGLVGSSSARTLSGIIATLTDTATTWHALFIRSREPILRALIIAVSIFASASAGEAQTLRKPELIPGAPVEEQLKEHGQYVDRAGEVVHGPAHSTTGNTPDGATAICGDSTFSFSHSHSGTCSRHGGVVQWLR